MSLSQHPSTFSPAGTLYSTISEDSSSRGQQSKKGPRRSVSTLSPGQLERKRANDREAQRLIRRRTKDRIDNLERTVETLKQENDHLKRRLSIPSGSGSDQMVDDQPDDDEKGVYDDEENVDWNDTLDQDPSQNPEPRVKSEMPNIPSFSEGDCQTRGNTSQGMSTDPEINRFAPPPLNHYSTNFKPPIHSMPGMTSSMADIHSNPNWGSLYPASGIYQTHLTETPLCSPPLTPHCDARSSTYHTPTAAGRGMDPGCQRPASLRNKPRSSLASDPYEKRYQVRF